MNHTPITIAGNLGADPELRFNTAGKAIARVRVAVTDRYRDESGEWVNGPTSWFNVVAWGRLAENAASLIKGDPALITGRLAQRDYETEQGEKRTAWEITADDIALSLRHHPTRGGTSATWEPAPVEHATT